MKGPRRVVLGALIAVAVLALPAVALAAPPDNDPFANPTDLGNGPTASDSGTNVEATKEGGEPDHGGDPGGASVWYEWTAPSNGEVRVDTCDSDFDTLLAVYTGAAVNALTLVEENDQACGDQSRLRFTAASGTTYMIAVDGWSDFNFQPADTGSVELNLEPADPGNDAFADAELLAGETPSATGSNLGATKEVDEPDHAGDPGGASLWYQWIAPSTGPFRVDVCNGDFDTLLGVYTGMAVDALAEVASSDEACGSQSRVIFDAVMDTTYWIAVDGWSDASSVPAAEGDFELNLAPASPPANDDFAAAENLGSGASVSRSSTNVDASAEPGEPFHAGVGGSSSIWYRWTAPSNGQLRVDTCGSDFDTALAVYTGAAVGSLIERASNDDAEDGPCAFDLQSRVAFNVAAGTTYRIAVDGFFGEQGAVELHLGHTPSSQPPTPPPDSAPDTAITRAPDKKTKKRNATFEFTSTEAGSTFECNVDGKGFNPCSSPHQLKKLKAKKGKGKQHTFEVRAIDAGGRVDPTPAEHAWKVKKKKRR